MNWTQQQYNIPPFDFGLWATYTGTGFAQLTEDDFKLRIPQVGPFVSKLISIQKRKIENNMYIKNVSW